MLCCCCRCCPYLAMQSHPDIQLGFLCSSPTCGTSLAFSNGLDCLSFSPPGGLFLGGLEPAEILPPPPPAPAFPRKPLWVVAFRATVSAGVVGEVGNLRGSSIEDKQSPHQGYDVARSGGACQGTCFNSSWIKYRTISHIDTQPSQELWFWCLEQCLR